KKHSPDRLYPATLEGEAKAWQWTLWAANEVERAVNIWSLHAVRLPPEDRDAQKRADALAVVAAPFRVLDGALASTPYLLGSDFTVADLNVAAVISRAIDMDSPRHRDSPIGCGAATIAQPRAPRSSCARRLTPRRRPRRPA